MGTEGKSVKVNILLHPQGFTDTLMQQYRAWSIKENNFYQTRTNFLYLIMFIFVSFFLFLLYKDGHFTFQCTLHKNGTIWFAYKEVNYDSSSIAVVIIN